MLVSKERELGRCFFFCHLFRFFFFFRVSKVILLDVISLFWRGFVDVVCMIVEHVLVIQILVLYLVHHQVGKHSDDPLLERPYFSLLSRSQLFELTAEMRLNVALGSSL